MNPNRPTPRNIVIKMTKCKDKEIILKTAREKQKVIYREPPIRLSANFSAKTLQDRRECHGIFKLLKGKTQHSRILYPERL